MKRSAAACPRVHGHAISPATISRWLSAHPGLTTYRRLRAEGRRLFAPPQLIRIVKLYHAQVYEFGCHRAKLAFLRVGTLDDRRTGDTKFAPLADFLANVPHACPHDLFRSDDAARASKLPRDFLALESLRQSGCYAVCVMLRSFGFLILFFILIGIWLVLWLAFHIAGALIHLLLIVAVIALILHLFRGSR